MAGQVVYVLRSARHLRGIHVTMIAGRLGRPATAAGDGGGTPPPSSGGDDAAFTRRKPFWVDPGCSHGISSPWTVMVRGRDIGYVWQSEYAPEPRYADARAHHRAP